jgi:hypothetical protein
MRMSAKRRSGTVNADVQATAPSITPLPSAEAADKPTGTAAPAKRILRRDEEHCPVVQAHMILLTRSRRGATKIAFF